MCVNDNQPNGSDDETDPDQVASISSPLHRLTNPFDYIYNIRGLHRTPGRTLFFVRHGESEYNVQERIGGNPPLTERGKKFARAFSRYINALDLPNIKIWTSTLKRAISTAEFIKGPKHQTSLLDEIKSGSLDGFTYKDFEEKFPDAWESRAKDKLHFKYPEGESYIDCCIRIIPLLIKMENEDNLVVVAHQAILRCIMGYLLKKPIESVPNIKIPQHTIIQVTLEGDENSVEFTRMPVEHVEQGITVASQENEIEEEQQIEHHLHPHQDQQLQQEKTNSLSDAKTRSQ